MRIITLNANGLRSAARKGLMPWLARQGADVICLQEVRANPGQLALGERELKGYHAHFHPAERPGYAGTAVFSRARPKKVLRAFGVPEFDREGRYLEAQFEDCNVVSLYLPSGSAGPERQASKFRFLEAFTPHLAALARRKKPTVLCGDWNIAHRNIDIRNWKSNQKNSGFLPEERAWLDQLFGPMKFVDAFRAVNSEPDQYTWWSARGQARANNVGWRIDYQIVTPHLAGAARKARIYKEQQFSDHAPLIMDYDFPA